MISIDQVKTFLGIDSTDTDYDDLFVQAVAWMADRFGKYIGGEKLVKSDRTASITPLNARTIIWLPAWPVVSVAEILESSVSGSAATAINSDEYFISHSDGHIRRQGNWRSEYQLTVTYTAGWTPAHIYNADGYTPEANEQCMPEDLQSAAILQTAFWFGRRKQLGVRATSSRAGDVTSYATDTLLPEVKDILNLYKRIVL